MLSLGRFPGEVIALSNGVRIRHLGVIQTRTANGDRITWAKAVVGVETPAWSYQYKVGVNQTVAIGGGVRINVLGIGNHWSKRTKPASRKPGDYLRLGVEAPEHVVIHREGPAHRSSEDEVRQAAEAVVATAFGGDGGPGYDHTYGLTEAQQLEALRGACQALADVLNPPSHIEMACGAYVEDANEMMRHSQECRNCREVVAEDKADMAHSDGEC